MGVIAAIAAALAVSSCTITPMRETVSCPPVTIEPATVEVHVQIPDNFCPKAINVPPATVTKIEKVNVPVPCQIPSLSKMDAYIPIVLDDVKHDRDKSLARTLGWVNDVTGLIEQIKREYDQCQQ